MTAVLPAAVALVAIICLLNVLLLLAVVRRLREQDAALAEFRAASFPDAGHEQLVGMTLPSFTATTIDGATVDDDTVRERSCLVGFFAAGCEPCHEIAPRFAAAGAGRRTFAVVVGSDPKLTAALAGADHVVVDGLRGGLADLIGVAVYPTLLVTSPGGIVVTATGTLDETHVPAAA